MNQEKLARLQQAVRTGGKGSVRRTKKIARKPQANNDRKLVTALKGFGLNQIPGIEEVVFVQDDGNVRVFNNPKLQAAVQANTFVITGTGEVQAANASHLHKQTKQSATDDVPDLVSGGVNFEEVATKDAKKSDDTKASQNPAKDAGKKDEKPSKTEPAKNNAQTKKDSEQNNAQSKKDPKQNNAQTKKDSEKNNAQTKKDSEQNNDFNISVQNDEAVSSSNDFNISIQNDEAVSSSNDNQFDIKTATDDAVSSGNIDVNPNDFNITIAHDNSVSAQPDFDIKVEHDDSVSAHPEFNISVEHEEAVSSYNDFNVTVVTDDAVSAAPEFNISVEVENPVSEAPIQVALVEKALNSRTYDKGEVTTAINYGDGDPASFPRLVRVSIQGNARASSAAGVSTQSVPLSPSSLNTKDMFILDNNDTVYQWGQRASISERSAASELARTLDDHRKSNVSVKVLDDIYNKKDADVNEFWKLLGASEIPEKISDDDSAAGYLPSVYKVDPNASEKFSLVAQGKKIHRSALKTDSVYLLDTGFEYYFWLGRSSPADVRNFSKSLAAEQYTKQKERPKFSVSHIREGGEDVLFEKFVPK